ncbi:YqaA family protein [Neokomagataea thailandica]|uniref:Alkaline phosphatase n=1 Tax=Neokomagataea tanensis NBRC 106556 TaxID=1223519 RepID=A0ABQ0QJI9_9PROT|nr:MULTISPECIES: YqaA family protein [Neokomagataea]GBR47082.1 alkaline phosphatase [Neokomagataea tanensis NBRC 106556]
MLTSLYNRLMALAASPRAPFWLIIVAAAEASIFPIPVDVMLIPMLLAHREHALRLAGLCTAASVAGGIIGWGLGAFLMEHIGAPIAHFYHAESKVASLESLFQHYGVWIILAKGLTPLPYKFVTIAAGAAHFSLIPFIAASIITRGARFYLEAILLKLYGEPIRHFIEKRLTILLLAALILILGGVALITLL